MSYLEKTEYKIVPKESFSVIRICSGCGRKTHFINTGKFRVNANGNKLDVWLIYQCENCRHTFNLTIRERQKASSLSRTEYTHFLENDEQTAERYGRDIRLFQKNRAEIDFENLHYEFVRLPDESTCEDGDDQVVLIIHNPCELRIRPEKQIAGAWGLSTSQVRKILREGKIELKDASSRLISVRLCTCHGFSPAI